MNGARASLPSALGASVSYCDSPLAAEAACHSQLTRTLAATPLLKYRPNNSVRTWNKDEAKTKRNTQERKPRRINKADNKKKRKTTKHTKYNLGTFCHLALNETKVMPRGYAREWHGGQKYRVVLEKGRKTQAEGGVGCTTCHTVTKFSALRALRTWIMRVDSLVRHMFTMSYKRIVKYTSRWARFYRVCKNVTTRRFWYNA